MRVFKVMRMEMHNSYFFELILENHSAPSSTTQLVSYLLSAISNDLLWSAKWDRRINLFMGGGGGGQK